MKTQVVLITAIASLSTGSVLAAQTSPTLQPDRLAPRYTDGTAGLDLEGAVAQALAREPGLRGARTEVDSAAGMRQQAGERPNPTFSFTQQEEPAGADRQTRVEVMWPLDLSRKRARVGVADREVEVARLTVADRERQLAADVRSRYGEVAEAVRELSVLDDLVAAVSREHALVASRVGQGAAPPLERDVLFVEMRRLTSEQLLQAGKVERALIDLKQSLGLAPDVPVTIRDTLEQLVGRAGATPPPTNEQAARTRPDVEAAQVRVRLADAQIERAQRDGGFDVNLYGMYMRMDAGFPQRAFGTSGVLEPIRGVFHYVAAGAAVTVPIRNRNQGAVAAAQAQRTAASAQLEAAQLAAQAEVAAARARDMHAQQAVTIYVSEVRALAKQNLDVVGQTYELGRATVFDVLAEQRRYIDVERGFTTALREAYEAQQALRRALGDLR